MDPAVSLLCLWVRVVPGATLIHLREPVVEGPDELAATFGILEKIVLQVGIALDHPDVTNHLVEHLGRTTGAPLLPQLRNKIPALLSQDPAHDFLVGK